MKSKELRIGNLAFIDGKVHEIRSRDIYHIEHTGLKAGSIPLTEEWLIKFGFEKRYSEWHSKICLEEDNSGEVYYSAGEGLRLSETIKYVHQLQNLYFALTGEELTLKSIVTKTK